MSSYALPKVLGSLPAKPGLEAPQGDKKNWSEALSRAFAQVVADALRGKRREFGSVTPTSEGARHETPALSARGPKRLDVNYSTPELGLGLGVSIKTINFRDAGSDRYTKNLSRVDAELRAEATDYHRRQPYSVLVAVVMLPADAYEDGSDRTPSSFGSTVQYYRPRARRRVPEHEHDQFERLFVGTYELNPPRGWFFDVEQAPPRRGKPKSVLTFDDLVEAIVAVYDERNFTREVWADES